VPGYYYYNPWWPQIFYPMITCSPTSSVPVKKTRLITERYEDGVLVERKIEERDE
jgi:hypothetical protein